MSTANRVIKNTIYLYIRVVIGAVLSLMTTRIVLNALGASDFGIFAVVGGAIAMLGFLSSSMTNATQRFMNFYEGKKNLIKQKEIFNIGLIIHFILAFTVVLILLLLAPLMFEKILTLPAGRVLAAKYVYACLVVSTFFTILSVPYQSTLNAHENMKMYALVGIIDAFLKFLIALAIAYSKEERLILYGILMSCVPIFNVLILWKYCKHCYEECVFKPKTYWNYSFLKEEMSFAGWNMLTSITIMLTRHGVGLVLNNFFGVIVNAAQGIANQLSAYLSTVSSNAMNALKPVIIKSEGSGNRARLHYTSLLGCRIAFLIFGFFSLPILFEMPFILELWLKRIPEWTVVFCRLQIILVLLEQLINGVATSIYANGNIRMYTEKKGILNLLPLLLSIILFYFGFPPYYVYISLILCWVLAGGVLIIFYAHQLVGLEYRKYIFEVLIPSIYIVVIPSLVYYAIVDYQSAYYRVFAIIVELIIYAVIGWHFSLQLEERKQIILISKKIYEKGKNIAWRKFNNR